MVANNVCSHFDLTGVTWKLFLPCDWKCYGRNSSHALMAGNFFWVFVAMFWNGKWKSQHTEKKKKKKMGVNPKMPAAQKLCSVFHFSVCLSLSVFSLLLVCVCGVMCVCLCECVCVIWSGNYARQMATFVSFSAQRPAQQETISVVDVNFPEWISRVSERSQEISSAFA